jgi:hemerythrin
LRHSATGVVYDFQTSAVGCLEAHKRRGRILPFLNWSPSCSIGVAALDAEHRHLFDLLNHLYDSIIDGSSSDLSTGAVLDQVYDFAIKHCAHEEELLAAAHYPDIAKTSRDHEELRRTIEDYRRRLAEHGGISMELANFLMEWVLQHILKEDKKCGAFLNAAGVH